MAKCKLCGNETIPENSGWHFPICKDCLYLLNARMDYLDSFKQTRNKRYRKIAQKIDKHIKIKMGR